MDFLQVALVFLILIVALALSILGIQVFFILRDLKKAIEKIDRMATDTDRVVKEAEKPVAAVAAVTEAIENGVKAVKRVARASKPSKRFFRRL